MKVEVLLELCNRLIRDLDVQGATSRGLAVAMGLGELRQVEPGTVIFEEGAPPEAVYVLIQGRVRVELQDSQGQRRELTTLRSPTLFGQMGYIDLSPRSATCVAQGPGATSFIVLERQVLEMIFHRTDELGTSLRRTIAASLLPLVGAARESDAVDSLLPRDPFYRPPQDDAQDSELGRLASTIQDWELDEVEVVYTEADQRRRR